MIEKQKFYNKTWFIWFCLMFLAPLGILLMWKKKRFYKIPRIVLSIFFGFSFILQLIVVLVPIDEQETIAASAKNSNIEQTIGKNDEVADSDEKTKVTQTKTEDNKDNQTFAVEGNLKIHYLNVGQADSILIQQNGENMLIDAGNNADSSLVVEYLRKQGVHKLDYIVGTHPHEDHIGGLDVVIDTFSIGKVFMPQTTATTQTFKDVVLAVKNKDLKITTPKVENSYNLGGATWTILAPNGSEYNDANNYSIVIKLKFGNNSFIFMGDAEDVSEGQILAKQLDIEADVLKVGHHGSSSSTTTEFLNKVNPKHAVISVGKDNKYGHPYKETMDKLKDKDVEVYRTDESGTIIATSDGNKITFNTVPGSYNYAQQVENISASDTTMVVAQEPKPITNNKEVMVYVTNSGKKYHFDGCRYLSKSKIPINLDEAKSKYDPCKVCHPPQ